MSIRLLRHRWLIAAAMLVVTGTTASADWATFWQRVHVGFYRNTAWPDPFNEADAAQVVMPFEAMTRNGWRMHNTIGHELFRAGDGALLASGQKCVRWIATQAPPTHRDIFVLRGATPEETAARVNAVREAVDGLVLDGMEPQVFVTNVQPRTAPGARTTKIGREWLEQMPAPKLPDTTAAGTPGVSQ